MPYVTIKKVRQTLENDGVCFENQVGYHREISFQLVCCGIESPVLMYRHLSTLISELYKTMHRLLISLQTILASVILTRFTSRKATLPLCVLCCHSFGLLRLHLPNALRVFLEKVGSEIFHRTTKALTVYVSHPKLPSCTHVVIVSTVPPTRNDFW